MCLLIIIFPLLGFLSGSLFGFLLGRNVIYITTSFLFLTLCTSFYLFFDVFLNGVNYKLEVMPWILIDSLNIKWSFLFDSVTVVMLIVINLISFLVHLYSINYMGNDPHLIRFMSYLSLFTFFMLILVTANNLLQMFVGWEGVGLASYLLISFWFTRIQASKAALKAMLVNRIGDFFLILSIFLVYVTFDTLDFDVLFGLVQFKLNYKLFFFNMEIFVIDLICIFMFLGAMGKSAQLGLHVWLPDAMEGPTPVSALIHAATMVTAGVFLLIRNSFFFEFSFITSQLIIVIGSLTAFFAATTGLFQNDLKKIIAYSTCSQLGYMVFACGLSSYETALFHLSNHAFFKALLFLSAGSVIHAINDEQDIRKMGGLKNLLPFSYAAILIGSLALTGFPFLAGFFSKESILELAYAKYNIMGWFAYTLGTLAAFFTAFYSIRLLFLVFLANPNGNRTTIVNAHEGSIEIFIPLFILSFFSMFIGYLTKEFFIGFGTDYWIFSIFVLPNNYSLIDIEFISVFYQQLPFIISILGITLAYLLYANYLPEFLNVKKNSTFIKIYYFFNRRWFFDKIYNHVFSQFLLMLSYNIAYKKVDRGLLEYVGPFHLVNFITDKLYIVKQLQVGSIEKNLFNIFIGVFYIFIFFFVTNAYLSIEAFIVYAFLIKNILDNN